MTPQKTATRETTLTAAPDLAKVEALVGTFVGFMTGGAVCAGIALGDELGLYRKLAELGETSADDLVDTLGLNHRLVREWIDGQAAAGLLGYEPLLDVYWMTPEAALVLADEDSPAFLAGGTPMFQAMFDAIPKLAAAFRGDGGVSWGDHHPALFPATARFFRPGYRTYLVSDWIPALHGVAEKLAKGATVADVGCGFGHSSTVMAEAFPNATIRGFDFHPGSIEAATKNATERGVGGRVSFDVAAADAFPGKYDLICFFDCLHDMGDPVGIAKHAREQLATDGTVLLVEPFALPNRGENIADNPAAAMFYNASTFICTPNSLSQSVGLGLGAQAGSHRTKEVFEAAGYSSMEIVLSTPFNLIYEAKA